MRRWSRVDAAESRRGAALFIVLVLCALLAVLAGAAMRTAVSGARAAAVFVDAARADALGASAGEVVIYQLLKGDAEARRGGSLAVRLPDAELSIDYVSESARVDVNTAAIPLIAALLSAAGADPALARLILARIEALRGPPEGQQGQQPKAAPAPDPSDDSVPTPPPPPPAPVASKPRFGSAIEVVAAWGLPADLARRLLPVLTTASGAKGVDPLLGDRLVVAALLGGDDARVDDYLKRRQQGFVNRDSALELLPEASRAFADFDDVPAVRAVAHVVVARRFERRYEILVASAQGAAPNPVVIGWRKLL